MYFEKARIINHTGCAGTAKGNKPVILLKTDRYVIKEMDGNEPAGMYIAHSACPATCMGKQSGCKVFSQSEKEFFCE
jgi:hypothetical protein